MKKKLAFLSILLISLLVLTACGGGAENNAANNGNAANVDDANTGDTNTGAADTGDTGTGEDTSGDRVEIRWFVGLGAGSDEPTFAPQEAVVEKFNASQDRIKLVLEIVDADVAADTLATQIAAGNAPDVVGPVGVKGRDAFKGAWLDLSDLIAGIDYDLSDFDEGMVQFYNCLLYTSDAADE